MTIYQRVKEMASLHREMGIPESDKSEKVLCPFHEDVNPSLNVFPNGRFKCYVCGESGDVISYVSRLQGVTIMEAAILLADELGIPLDDVTPEQLEALKAAKLRAAVFEFAAAYFEKNLEAIDDSSTPWGYLVQTRGFRPDVLRKWRVGFCPPGGKFARAAQGAVQQGAIPGATLQTFEEFGLLASKRSHWRDVFAGRLTFPYFDRRGRVLFIDARTVGLPIEGEPKFIGTKAFKPSFYPCPDFKKGGSVVLLEGITDTLTMLSWDVQARGVPGVRSFNAAPLAGLETITFLWDNDKAGDTGVVAAIKETVAVSPGANIGLLRLPEGVNDVNDWAKDNGLEAFRAMLPAPPAVQVLVQDIARGAEADPAQKARLMEPIYQILANYPAVAREGYIASIRTALKISASASKDAIRRVEVEAAGKKPATEREEEFDVVYDAPPEIVPAQNYFMETLQRGTATMTIYQIIRKNGEYLKEPFLIQSHYQDGRISVYEPLHISKFADLSQEFKDRLPDKNVVFGRWRGNPQFPSSHFNFCRGMAPDVDPAKIFWGIVDLCRRFIWVRDQRAFFIVASYIMMTYIHRLFPAVPYLHIHGIAGSGKNQLLSIFHALSFNVEQSALSTPAAMSRSIEANLPTFLYDEAEQLNNPKPGTMAEALAITLNSGYRSDGSRKVSEALAGGGWTTREFSTFCPKILASITRLNNTLTSRCITLRMRTAPKEELAHIDDFSSFRDEIDEDLLTLRDQLYCWAFSQFYEIERIRRALRRDPDVAHIVARQRDIWFPLLTLARHCSDLIPAGHPMADGGTPFQQMVELQIEMENEIRAWAADEKFDLEVLVCLHELLFNHDVAPIRDNFYPLNDIANRLTELLADRDAIKMDTRFTGKKFQEVMRRLEYPLDRREMPMGTQKVRAIALDLPLVDSLIETIGGKVPEAVS